MKQKEPLQCLLRKIIVRGGGGEIKSEKVHVYLTQNETLAVYPWGGKGLLVYL